MRRALQKQSRGGQKRLTMGRRTGNENLIRADLTTSQRAKLAAQRKKAYLAAHPQTKRGGDRRSKSQVATLKKDAAFIDDTATKTGKHRATIARDVARAEAVLNSTSVIIAVGHPHYPRHRDRLRARA